MNKEIRDIRLVFLVFSAFFVFFAYKHCPSIVGYILISFAVVILCLIAFAPLTLRPIFKVWMKVAHAIGNFNTQLLLTIAFIIIFVPIGLVMRLIRRDVMKKKFKSDSSYWEQYEIAGMSDKNRYKRQF